MIYGLFFNLNEKITVLVFRRLILSLLFIVFFSFNNIDAQEYWSKADKEIMQFQNLKERKDWHYLKLDNEKLRSSLLNKKSLSSKSKKNYITILLPNERGIAEDFLL
ncbi:MAG: hypothetical protein CMC10_05055, partial [Flavobacteriaceae bacterium]|nr:hypothetical protein [Flavobacteriaceae bacterium]